MAEINMDAVAKSPFTVNWRPWMKGPCCVCDRDLDDDEGRLADFILNKVICEPCSYGGCRCLCHATVQPGLVPCPNCKHSSRYGAPEKMEP